MIRRKIADELLRLAGEYPVVVITGPRQSGKTTLAKMEFPDFSYANLETPESREYARRDPKGFLDDHPRPLVIDEVQRVPELLSWIQPLVDQDLRRPQYVLTGSNQFQLMQSLTQSLAGRAALATLLPFSFEELEGTETQITRDEALVKGFLPRVHAEALRPTQAYGNYFRTYVERDLRLILNVKDLTRFETFLRLLAGRVGQVVNLAGLGNEAGVSGATVKEWLSALEASYIIFRLPAFSRNLGKRLVKSPKLYFVEPGLAAYLLQIETATQASRDPLLGGLFENMVVTEVVKAHLNRGRDPAVSYFRDNAGHEIDLIVERNRVPHPVEIKSGKTIAEDWFRGLRWFSDLAEPYSGPTGGTLVYGGEERRGG
ncbi:MAG: ATP-binding protein, partial [Spirochaetaceae bacterium]|nr:ATP-binding protein [Spirochaetaceae bacterium]